MSDSRRQTLRQFLTFAVIGTCGAVVDSGVLYGAMHGIGLDHYSGRLVSWFAAATFTWAMNRHFTFAHRQPLLTQWAKFLAANAVGGIINYAVYGALVAESPLVAAYPFIGVGFGSLAGLGFNFSASKWVVFRARKEHPTDGIALSRVDSE